MGIFKDDSVGVDYQAALEKVQQEISKRASNPSIATGKKEKNDTDDELEDLYN